MDHERERKRERDREREIERERKRKRGMEGKRVINSICTHRSRCMHGH